MEKKALELELTPEQREQLKKVTGKDVPAVKLSLEPLEERMAPRIALN
jgi:hypothetical protein